MVLMLYYYSFFGTSLIQLLTISIDSKCIISLDKMCEPEIEMNRKFDIKLKKKMSLNTCLYSFRIDICSIIPSSTYNY